MRKISVTCLIPVFIFSSVYSQSDSVHSIPNDTVIKNIPTPIDVRHVPLSKKISIYTLKPKIDIPLIACGTAWSVYAFTKIYKKTPPTTEQIEGLKRSDINAFDRWAVYPYSQSLDNLSYYPFYASIPLPLVFFLTGKETRSDFLRLSFLYWETMSVTGLLGTGATYNVDRYRPYAYRSETPMDKRTGSIAKNSFYAGHVQVVAAPTFFIAKVYADYHPDSKIKWLFYGLASAATGVTAYMRIRAGEHFPSDVLLGTATGALAGILVPHYHLTKSVKGAAIGILPYSADGVNGFILTCQLK